MSAYTRSAIEASLDGGDLHVTVPRPRTAGSAISDVFSESDPSAAIAELGVRLQPAIEAAIDIDEVAAILEATGINDRVAVAQYAQPSVFALATAVELQVRGRVARQTPPPAPPPPKPEPLRNALIPTVIRCVLYLTPAALAYAGTNAIGELPRLVTLGALVIGWAGGQGLAALGWQVLGLGGRSAAARLVGAGFLVIAAVWFTVMVMFGMPWPVSYAVVAGELVLFAAVGVTLITGRERWGLLAVLPAWGLAGISLVTPLPTWAFGSLAAVLLLGFGVVAYWPALAPPQRPWQLSSKGILTAVGHAAIGAGQAALFVSVVTADSAQIPLAAIPLIIGVPVTELGLLWHQRRIAAARAALDTRPAFARLVMDVGASTLAGLATPLVIGGLLAVTTWVTAGDSVGIRLACGVLLTALFGQTLVLVAHGRLVAAIVLIWWPAGLAVAQSWQTWHAVLGPLSAASQRATPAVLLLVCLPGLIAVGMAICDPRSYR